MATPSSSFTIRRSRVHNSPVAEMISSLWSSLSPYRADNEWNCTSHMAVKSCPRLEVDCCMWVHAAPGIPTGDWPCPNSTWNFVIRRTGPLWRRGSAWIRCRPPPLAAAAPQWAPPASRYRTGFRIVPFQLLDSIWGNMRVLLPSQAASQWKPMLRPPWNVHSPKTRLRLIHLLFQGADCTPCQYKCLLRCHHLPRGMHKT